MDTKVYDDFEPYIKVYDDFEPFCKWQTDSSSAILNIYLQGFQKEQIKIEMNSKNEVIIHGERPSEGSPNRMKRFHKELRVSPHEFNIQEIEASFEGDCLSIFMPKKVVSNILFGDQLLRLKHLYRRPVIGDRTTTVKASLAVALGMALGLFLAYKYSHFSSVPSNND